MFRKSFILALVFVSAVNYVAADNSKKCRSSRIPIQGTEAEIVYQDGQKAKIENLHQKGRNDLERMDFNDIEAVYLRDNKTGIIAKHEIKDIRVSSNWILEKRAEFDAKQNQKKRYNKSKELLDNEINAIGENNIIYAPSQLIVGFDEGTGYDEIYGIINNVGGEIIQESLLDKVYLVFFPTTKNLDDIILVLNESGKVSYAHHNRKLKKLSITPNDFIIDDSVLLHQRNESAFDALSLPAAWGFFDINNDGAINQSEDDAFHNVVIAIVDTGVDYNHYDLVDRMWINSVELNGVSGDDDDGNGFDDDIRGWNFNIIDNNDPMDTDGHGTHVAGIASATTDNRIGTEGMAGVAWAATIMPVKRGDWEWNSINAITYAANNGADIINMSFGQTLLEFSEAYQDAIDTAYYDKDCVFVGAAGNDGDPTPKVPARLNRVVCVGGLRADYNTRYEDSNYGEGLDVMAPWSIVSTMPISKGLPLDLGYNEGTSMSTPFVSGIAALMRAAAPHHTSIQITQLLESSQVCDDLGTAGWDEETGWGRINAYKAVKSVIAEITPIAHENGTMSPADGFWVERGRPASFTATPINSDYEVDYWLAFYQESGYSETVQTGGISCTVQANEDMIMHVYFKESDSGPDPFGDLEVLSPAESPYTTGDETPTFEFRVPDGTDRIEWHNTTSSDSDNIYYNNQRWRGSVYVIEGTNNLSFTAYDSENNALASTNFVVIKISNTRTVTVNSDNCEWGYYWQGNPGVHNSTGGILVGWFHHPSTGDYGWEQAVVRFDIPNLPGRIPGSVISSQFRVKLEEIMSVRAGICDITAAAIWPDWQFDVDEVTWNTRPGWDGGTAWITDTDSAIEAKVETPGSTKISYYDFDASQAVEYWVSGVTNKGFRLKATGRPFDSGSYPVTETCERYFDGDGFRLTIEYQYDTDPPTLNITSPANNTTVSNTTTSITVSGTASNNSNTSISSVTWKNNTTGETGTASSTTSWSFSTGLAVGANQIAVTAKDAVDNTASQIIIVNRAEPDTTSPDNVTNCSTIPYPEAIVLKWQNPTNLDFAGVLILKSENPVSATLTNGIFYLMGENIGNAEVLYAAEVTSIVDAGLNPFEKYYYKIYAYDDFYNYASGVALFGIPLPQPDITGEGVVNLLDYSSLASEWASDCNDLNNWCNKADIDRSGEVGITDLLVIAENWLNGVAIQEGTPIFVANHSFETPVIDSDIYLAIPAVSAWTEEETDVIFGSNIGTLRNLPLKHPETIINVDGKQMAFIGGDGINTLYQDLSATYQAGKIYEMKAGASYCPELEPQLGSLRLGFYYIDPNTLNRIDITSSYQPPTALTTYMLKECSVLLPTVKSDDPWAGANIGIFIQDSGSLSGFWNVDNIRAAEHEGMPGSGTAANPFLISTRQQLESVNWNPLAHYKLVNNIDLSGHSYYGALIYVFDGVFDGNNHKITGLTVTGDHPLGSGLFGLIFISGQVFNLGIESATVTGYWGVGGLAGLNEGTISRCYASTDNRSSFTDEPNPIGGLVGYNSGIIEYCYATGTVEGLECGGLVGYNCEGVISNCYTNTNVHGEVLAGGLCGLLGEDLSPGLIENCYATGIVVCNEAVGGMCGFLSPGSIITNSYWDVETSGIGSDGDDNFGATGKTTAEMKTQNTFKDWDFTSTWNIEEGNCYPYFRRQELP